MQRKRGVHAVVVASLEANEEGRVGLRMLWLRLFEHRARAERGEDHGFVPARFS